MLQIDSANKRLFIYQIDSGYIHSACLTPTISGANGPCNHFTPPKWTTAFSKTVLLLCSEKVRLNFTTEARELSYIFAIYHRKPPTNCTVAKKVAILRVLSVIDFLFAISFYNWCLVFIILIKQWTMVDIYRNLSVVSRKMAPSIASHTWSRDHCSRKLFL